MTDGLAPGDTLVCDEAKAENPEHDFGADYRGLGPRYVRFNAQIDGVQGDYVEATVVSTNGHLRAPDRGAHLALSAAKLSASRRWSHEPLRAEGEA